LADKIKVISSMSPFGRFLVNGHKKVEVKTQRPPKTLEPGTRVVIHSGQKFHKGAKAVGYDPDEYPIRGACLGTVIFLGYVEYETHDDFDLDYERHLNPSDWYEKGRSFGWIFTSHSEWKEPVPYKGNCCILKVDRSLFPEL